VPSTEEFTQPVDGVVPVTLVATLTKAGLIPLLIDTPDDPAIRVLILVGGEPSPVQLPESALFDLQLTFTARPQEALGWLDRRPFDILLVNGVDPTFDIVAFCRQVRDRCDWLTLPILIVTRAQGLIEAATFFWTETGDYLSGIVNPSLIGHQIIRTHRLLTELREAKDREDLLQSQAKVLEAVSRELDQSMKRQKRLQSKAASVQHLLLPSATPNIPGVSADWKYIPVDTLGGDCLDIIRLSDTKFGLYLIDVAGHGLSAAMFSVIVSSCLWNAHSATGLLWEAAKEGTVPPPELELPGKLKKLFVAKTPTATLLEPATVLNKLNQIFQMGKWSSFYFTILYAVYDTENSTLTYASAGHPPPIHMDADGHRLADTLGGPPIGFLQEHAYEQYVLQLHEGQEVLFYTDGLTEARGTNGIEYGSARLEHWFADGLGLPLMEQLDRLVEESLRWSERTDFEDDVTALLIKVTAEITPAGSPSEALPEPG